MEEQKMYSKEDDKNLRICTLHHKRKEDLNKIKNKSDR